MRCRYFYFRRIFVQPKFFRILPHKSIGISVFKRKKRVLSKLLSKFIASYLKIWTNRMTSFVNFFLSDSREQLYLEAEVRRGDKINIHLFILHSSQCKYVLFILLCHSFCVVQVSMYILDVLWCQPTKLIHIAFTSEFHEYWWKDVDLFFFIPSI